MALAQRRSWDFVKKVQETEHARKSKKTDPEEARTIRARQRAIGRELRRFYDNVAEEPVPEDFMDLLRKMDGEASGGDEEGNKAS